MLLKIDERKKVDISIVIVTMNHLSKVVNLMPTIEKLKGDQFSFEVIMVDNCSSDGTVEFVRGNYPDVILKVNTEVNGFAYNNNLGAALSSGEYIFICNPDIILMDKSVEKMLHFAKAHPKTGILCPQLLNPDLSYQQSIRNFHSLKIMFYRLLSRGNDNAQNKVVKDYLLIDFDKKVTQNVDWAIGAAMLLKRQVYQELKGFDEKFFLYVEDEDLCLRAWQSNYEVTYYPEAVMIHDHQRSSASKINKLTWFHLKSFVYFIFKYKLFFKNLNRKACGANESSVSLH